VALLGAPEALALGMVNGVVPTDQLDAATRQIVDAIAAGA
jgi:enoyl-CoA hydratase/carnithine racemase